jgi:hypothetical protein
MELEHVVAHQANLVLPFIYAPLLPHEFEIVAPFRAIFVAHVHIILSFALERSMVLCLT